MSQPALMGRRRRLLIWWLASTSILLVVLLAVGAYFVVSTVRSFVQAHHTACLPGDFPIFTSTTVLEVDETFPAPQNGALAECHARLTTKYPYDSVNSFYRSQLNAGDWSTTSYSEDVGRSTTSFHRRSHPATRGLLSIQKLGDATDLDVQLIG